MITREQALKLLHDNMQSVNLRRHCYAVEAVMRALARKFQMTNSKLQIDEEKSSDAKAMEDKWALVGLLHDGDYEKTKDNPEQHTLMMMEWLEEAGETDTELLGAILSHNYAHLDRRSLGEGGNGHPPSNKMEWALYCCDELTGLIIAVALVRPDKRLSSVTIDSVMRKWDEKSFATGVHREQIAECEQRLGIPLQEFIAVALNAMQEKTEELGL